jgi:hypothetical protein
MLFNYDDNDLSGGSNFNEGLGFFTVINCEEMHSKSNKPMLKLALFIEQEGGGKGRMFDYILGETRWKVAQFSKAVGKYDEFKANDVRPEHIKDLSGFCKIHKKAGEEYFSIKSYIDKDEFKSTPKPSNDIVDDDIDF